MMSVKRIVDWVNAYGSPIHIMDNEMLSIPFVADLDGKMYMVIMKILKDITYFMHL
jgi:hypothetical protein